MMPVPDKPSFQPQNIVKEIIESLFSPILKPIKLIEKLIDIIPKTERPKLLYILLWFGAIYFFWSKKLFSRDEAWILVIFGLVNLAFVMTVVTCGRTLAEMRTKRARGRKKHVKKGRNRR
jgi:hypothetical protein